MAVAINSFAGAAAAYARASEGLAGAAEPPGRPGGSTFAEMLKGAIGGAIATDREGEQLSMAAIGDGADLIQVVTAVAEAETVLNTVMAVRDRVIDAYQPVDEVRWF